MSKIYCVYDKKVGFNQAMMVCDNDDVAVRNFANVVNTPGSLIHSNPEDFNLHSFGTFSVEKGIEFLEDVTLVEAQALKKSEV